MPPFAAGITPSAMGAVSEAVRSATGAVRSAHPQSSFAAVGPRAAWLMARHPLRCHLGPSSPLGKLAAHRAQVLMLGVGYGAFSGFHLAEYTYRPDPPLQTYECVLAGARGMPCWTRFTDVVLDDRPFEAIGAAMEAAQADAPWVRHGQVGAARCRLLPLRPAVEFAERWLRENRVADGRGDAAPR
jgi:aminoglycoside 3-N-acetyltransferase